MCSAGSADFGSLLSVSIKVCVELNVIGFDFIALPVSRPPPVNCLRASVAVHVSRGVSSIVARRAPLSAKMIDACACWPVSIRLSAVTK